MIRIILCEGKTDAILLSYYLERTKGWEHDKKPKYFKLEFPTDVHEYIYYRMLFHGNYCIFNNQCSLCNEPLTF